MAESYICNFIHPVVVDAAQQEMLTTKRDVLVLNSMVEKIIFGNILRIYGTLDNHLPTHGSSVYDLNQVHEILLGLEATDKLGVIRGAEREISKIIKLIRPIFFLFFFFF